MSEVFSIRRRKYWKCNWVTVEDATGIALHCPKRASYKSSCCGFACAKHKCHHAEPLAASPSGEREGRE